MNRSARLTLVVAQILAGGLIVGCRSLDDEACLAVELDEECPSVAEAQEELEGRRTCESPVREVTRVGELVSSAEAEDTGNFGVPQGPHIACCYEAAYKVHGGQSCVVGRPLRIDGEVSLAGVTERCDWVAALDLPPSALSPVARAALAAHWQADAELEHASVAAFARVTLELMALGAPADLLARTAEAQADEIRHAKECFALASAYAGRAIGPGMLGMPPLRQPSLVQIAICTRTSKRAAWARPSRSVVPPPSCVTRPSPRRVGCSRASSTTSPAMPRSPGTSSRGR
jgi:hypothetical protein